MYSAKISKQVVHIALCALVSAPIAVFAQSAKSPAGSASEGSTGKSSATQGAQSSGASGAASDSAKSPSGSASEGSTGKSSASGDTAGATASSSGAASGAVGPADRQVMRELAQANLAEIETGKLAQSKSQNEQVKSFAQKMVDDHGKALQDLQKVAQAKGVTLPNAPDAKHRAMAKKLEALSGDQFDRRYMAQGGLMDHRQTHRMLQRAQARVKDADLKQLVQQTLPVVDQHLNMAQDLASAKSQRSAGASGASGTAGGSSAGSGTSK